MRSGKLTLGVVSLLVTVLTTLPINLLVPFSVPQALAQTVEERKAEADRLVEQGLEQLNKSQIEVALVSFQQALAIYREARNRLGEGKVLGALGLAYAAQRDYSKAIEYYDQSLIIFREIKDSWWEGSFLIELGSAYLALKDYPKAIDFYQQAFVIARQIQDQQVKIAALSNLGVVYRQQGDNTKAIQYLEEGLIIARKINDRQGEGNILHNLGVAYRALRDYRKAIKYYEESLSIVREMNDRRKEGETLGNMGNVYSDLREYEKAITYHKEALVIARETQNRQQEAKILNYLGNDYEDSGNYEQAIESYEQSLMIVQEINYRKGEGQSLENLGSLYGILGKYSEAIEYVRQALAIAREINDSQEEQKALITLGFIYQVLGEYEKAIKYHEQALVIARKINDRYGEGIIIGNLGAAYHASGNYAKGIEYFQQSLAIAQEMNDSGAEGKALGNLGLAYYTEGDYKKAIEYLRQRLVIARKINDTEGEGTALGSLGLAYQALSEYDQAIELYQQSLAINRAISDRRGEGIALTNLGSCFLASGKLVEAEKTLRVAINFWESIRANLASKIAEKVSFFELYSITYKHLEEVLIAQNRFSDALEVTEQGRTRAFVELLARRLGKLDNELKPHTSLTLREIQQISYQEKATIVQYSIISSKFLAYSTINDEKKALGKPKGQESELYIWVIKPTGEIAFRKVDLKPLWQQQNTSLQELVTKNLEFVSAGINRGESDNPTLSNNSSFAPGDLIRRKKDPANYPAWQVVSVNPQNRTLVIRQPSFIEGVTIEYPIANVTKVSSPNAQNKRLQQLHKLLIEPIADLLPTDPNARVIFIPQGALFFVPFPALQDADSKFLIEKHTILTAPSIQVLDLTHQQRQRVPGTTKDVLVVGNPTMPEVSPFPGEPARQLSPLPAAEREATEVAQMFKTQAVIGNQATKTAILPQLSKARIIHLATHGLLDDYTGGGVPGAIALAPSPNDNGLLTASEILDLKLNAELVVLSACNTGKGRITGDGVIGLSRSLISAGVPSVVVSLWSVPDAPTASLMTEFYRQMQKSPDKAQALRQAMLTTIRTHPNPKDWAAFTLIGEAE